MTAAVETMAYAGQVPWHGLGNKVSDTMSPEQMLKAAKIDWTVSTHPVLRKVNGHVEEIPGRLELRRDSDNAFFDIVGSTWKPVQNAEAFDFFKKFVKEAKMKMETAGSLWDGKYVWGLARMSKDFSVGKGNKDPIHNYLLLASPHQHGKAFLALFTSVRVVCWNTLTASLGGSWQHAAKRAGTFAMPHSQKFDDKMKKKAAEALGLAVEQADEYQEVVQHLAKKRAKPEQVDEYFFEVLRFDPAKATKKKDGEARVPLMLPKLQQALLQAPGHDLPSANGTWWGALNAVTYVVDHETGRGDRSTAMKNAWLGYTAGTKRRALDLAIEYAK